VVAARASFIGMRLRESDEQVELLPTRTGQHAAIGV
jgi:hypothetical protein